ncbi:MAG TPA: SDR family NAD(P)-dependent oxidoreductase, partial [Candidatus Limnocylindrales bacterium]
MSRLAVVTGASSGIGAATARLLLEQGWRVIAVARRRERLEALGDGVIAVPVDLTDADAPERVRAAVEAAGGSLGLLVNNAGAEGRSTFGEGGYANVRQTMDVNFDAVV